MSAYKSDFLNVLASRGFIHQVSEPDALDELARIAADHRLYRLRLHRGLAARRLAAADHDAALAAADRPPADRADGRRHHARRRSRPARTRAAASSPTRRSTRISRASARSSRKFLKFEGAGGNAIMANNADWLNSLNYIDFLRDVGRHFSVNRMLSLRFGEDAARPPAGAVVPRIQLHDPAGLRLRRAEQAHRLRAADGRLRPVGQHRQRHRSRPAHAERAAVRADLAADHHQSPAPRWARPRPARSGSTPTW